MQITGNFETKDREDRMGKLGVCLDNLLFEAVGFCNYRVSKATVLLLQSPDS